ncbi:hypothetical protein Sjap_008712 [Stephania japonica]|uniref:BHLH domain-containing protein n=1 Tax=Stephania japonica TaxID=461633 RepID=A0AAP0JQ16_9MAGN
MSEEPSRLFVPSRATTVPKPSRDGDEELVELLWQDGQIVMQSQSQSQSQSQNNDNDNDGDRSLPKKPLFISNHHQNGGSKDDGEFWIQEDEMASWLHDYDDPSSGSDLLDKVPAPSKLVGETITVVDSSATPRMGTAPAAAAAKAETATVTSSEEDGSEEQAGADKKRKGREREEEEEEEDDDWHSEDAGLDSAITKKNVCVPTTPRRSRAAEVHNLSERRRRDRINEKMKALQELIPCCNKSDKASMLDEAIEYLKSLQFQVQMMSMGSCMMPFRFPGVHQYMPPLLMGMGMGMDAGLNHQMLSFPPVLAGPSMHNPAAMNLTSRVPMAAFRMPPVSSTDPSTNVATGMMDNALNSSRAQNPSLLHFPNFTDQYPHILGLHHMQVHACPPRPSVTGQGTFAAENPPMPLPNMSKGADSLKSNKFDLYAAEGEMKLKKAKVIQILYS